MEGKIELTPDSLVILAEGRRYEIVEVVSVTVEVTGSPDPHGLVGKVKSKADLTAMGAEIMETSMIIGDNAYDIVPGWAGTASTPFAAHLDSGERMRARRGKTDSGKLPQTDEEMLERFAMGFLG